MSTPVQIHCLRLFLLLFNWTAQLLSYIDFHSSRRFLSFFKNKTSLYHVSVLFRKHSVKYAFDSSFKRIRNYICNFHLVYVVKTRYQLIVLSHISMPSHNKLILHKILAEKFLLCF